MLRFILQVGVILGFAVFGFGIFGLLTEFGAINEGTAIRPAGIALAIFLILGGGSATYFCLRKIIKLSNASSEAEPREVELKGSEELPKRTSRNQENSTDNSTKIFISYRRSDSTYITGRIYDRLLRTFAGENIFRDVDDIPFGVDFRKHIDEMIKDCDVCLVIIGSKWLEPGKSAGTRRIDDSRDVVRIEIESALARDIPVIPVVVDGAQIPSTEELPASIQALAFRNGIPVRPDPDFHQDMDRLINGLREMRKSA